MIIPGAAIMVREGDSDQTMFILNRGTLGVFGEGKRIARVEETGGLYFLNLGGEAHPQSAQMGTAEDLRKRR